MVKKRSILIASNTQDMPTLRPVAEILARKGHQIIDYQADAVAYGLIPFTITVSDSEELVFWYNGQRINPHMIDAAWFRRPTDFGIQFENEDRATRLSVDNERMAAQHALWDAIPAGRWLNAPAANRLAGQKLSQLARARQLGFAVPKTIVANRREAIEQHLASESIIFKSFYGIVSKSSGSSNAVYTTLFKNPFPERPAIALPYPGIWQEYIPKAREWRITVVGDSVFDVAIITQANAKDDWRRPLDDKSVTYRHEVFPETEKRKCFALLRAYGLRFGAFDFIETPDGRIVFLEMNPNGQYGWLEQELGLPISEAIASELLKVAGTTG